MTMLDVPYTALGAEMTSDYDERSSLANFRNMLSQVANFATALIFFILPVFTEKFGNLSAGWSATMALYGAAASAAILIGWKATSGYELSELSCQEKIGYKDFQKYRLHVYTLDICNGVCKYTANLLLVICRRSRRRPNPICADDRVRLLGPFCAPD